MQQLDIKPHYNVIIIGSGVSGLTSAALLSKAGLSVCVLEMDIRPGGYLAGFRRKDFRFDTAIHWLNQCGPNGLVHRVFDAIGLDHPNAAPQVRIRRYKGQSFDYLLTNNPNQMRDDMIRDYPHEKKGITKFFKSAQKIGRSFKNYSYMFRTEDSMGFIEKIIYQLKKLRFALPFIPYIMYTGEEGITKGLNKFFKDKGLHKIFCADPDMLSCLIPISWAYVNDFQSPPKGGSQVFPEWLSYVLNSYGNDLYFKCRVKEVLLENNVSTGVLFEHRGNDYTVKSDYIIAACDVETLYERMLPEHIVPAKFKKKLRNAKLYSSSITVSIALDCPTEDLGFNKEGIHMFNESVTRKEHGSGDPEKSHMCILAPSLRDKSMAPDGKGTLTIYIPAYFDQNNNWKTEIDAEGNLIRGEEYKKLKKECAEILIKRLEAEISPGLSDHILFMEVATPITHWRYTGNRNGSMMGARPGRENMMAKIAHYKTPVKNLFLGGHWADLGGGVPLAVKSAANTSLIILKKENKEAFKLLSKYMDGKINLSVLKGADCFKPYDNSWIQKLTPSLQKQKAKESHQ